MSLADLASPAFFELPPSSSSILLLLEILAELPVENRLASLSFLVDTHSYASQSQLCKLLGLRIGEARFAAAREARALRRLDSIQGSKLLPRLPAHRQSSRSSKRTSATRGAAPPPPSGRFSVFVSFFCSPHPLRRPSSASPPAFDT